MLLALIRRDLALMAGRPGEWLMPLAFFLLVALLLPFAIGPDVALLARLAPGILWVGALLASLIPVSTLFALDSADGTLDQLMVRGIAAETLAAARLVALWLGFGGPLLLAAPLAALMLGMPLPMLPPLLAGLLAGALGLSALAVIAGSVTLGARGGAGLVALLVLPLAIPMLLFGSSPTEPGALGLAAATAMMLAAVAPFAGGAALRASRG
ncbi:heme ABC transporter permease CcmB [Sandaracinobacter neustonicus]|uniref:Heme exporter protein B n=1 Tax=Sandaracinobacter neustonicus TaxID=1715348 RepID=A0A501XTR4_9SPHN|nr:heme ABC transporter permease CcmB [Sandaracinobacter neustonicus]